MFLALVLGCLTDEADSGPAAGDDTDLPDTGETGNPDSSDSQDTDDSADTDTGTVLVVGDDRLVVAEHNGLKCYDDAAQFGATTLVPLDSGDTQAWYVPLDTDEGARLWLLVYAPLDPTVSAYAEGLPVIVVGAQSVNVDYTRGESYVQGTHGFVEIRPVPPGWTLDGYTSDGEVSHGGRADADALRLAMLFAAGRRKSADGEYLGQVVGRRVCDSEIVPAANSSGGSTTFEALALWSDELAPIVAGIATYETPTSPQYVAGEAGAPWMDPDSGGDGDGDSYTWDDGRNLSYAAGPCGAGDCPFDYTTISWEPLRSYQEVYPDYFLGEKWGGLLYLDRDGDHRLTLGAGGGTDGDGDGVVSQDEDWVITPFLDPDVLEEQSYKVYTVQATQAAIAAGTLTEDAWPADVATLAEATAFWEEHEQIGYMDAIAAAYGHGQPLVAGITYTEVDHGQAQPSRPHIVELYGAFQSRGAQVRANVPLDVASCYVQAGPIADYAGGAEVDADLKYSNVQSYAIPEKSKDSLAKMLNAFQVFIDRFGMVDHCPME